MVPQVIVRVHKIVDLPKVDTFGSADPCESPASPKSRIPFLAVTSIAVCPDREARRALLTRAAARPLRTPIAEALESWHI